jgi:hypothetical protein
MIKTYTIQGTRFDTITIPKATLLFRGLSFENPNNYTALFNDFIGYRNGKYYNIAPTMNVFFYPIPYISDAINNYNIHTMYLTQYDIELMLLVKPGLISRTDINNLSTSTNIINICNNISENDKCGNKMSDVDPCLTEKFIKQFPHIAGYIGLEQQDIYLIYKKYEDMINKYNRKSMAKHILPGFIKNIKELSGIPEIAIHPLHLRQNDCLLVTQKFYDSEVLVNYCIKNRVKYNYFPLLYFTNNNILQINEFKNDNNLKLIANNSRKYDSSQNLIPELYENINEVFEKMLNNGYEINGTIYKVLIDTRTGFYRAFISSSDMNDRKKDKIKTTPITRKKIKRNFKDDQFEGLIDSYIIKPNDSEINTIVSTHESYLDNLLMDLNKNGFSIKKKLVFDRKNKNKFIYNYYVDKVLDRPDLAKYTINRKRRKNTTLKNIESKIVSSLEFDNLDLSNLDNISSIDSNI